MEWENKLSAIVKETEVNLARVKHQFGNRDSEDLSREIGFGPLNNHLFYPLNSTLISTDRKSPVSGSGQTLSLSLINQLKSRLDDQSRIIDKLSNTVQKLEADNNLYKQNLRNIEKDIYQLSTRLEETSRSDQLKTDRQIRHVKHDLKKKLEYLSSKINLLKPCGKSSQHIPLSYLNSPRKKNTNGPDSLDRIHLNKMTALRMEMDVIKTEMGNLEKNINVPELNGHTYSPSLDMSFSSNTSRLGRNYGYGTGSISSSTDSIAEARITSSVDFLKKKTADLELKLRTKVYTNHKSPRSIARSQTPSSQVTSTPLYTDISDADDKFLDFKTESTISAESGEECFSSDSCPLSVHLSDSELFNSEDFF